MSLRLNQFLLLIFVQGDKAPLARCLDRPSAFSAIGEVRLWVVHSFKPGRRHLNPQTHLRSHYAHFSDRRRTSRHTELETVILKIW